MKKKKPAWDVIRGGSRNLRKGGGGHNILGFFRTAASLETRASPKKADKRRGTCTKWGGIYRKMFQKGGGGHEPAVPPLNPPLDVMYMCSPSGHELLEITRINVDPSCMVQLIFRVIYFTALYFSQSRLCFSHNTLRK